MIGFVAPVIGFSSWREK